LLHREKKIAVFSEIHAKHLKALWAEHRNPEKLKLVVHELSLAL
jgi:hypothetical protein